MWMTVALLVVAYLLLPLSTLPNSTGRHNPSLASWLSPPLLNFHGSYDSGKALGIKISMTRDDLRSILKRVFSSDVLTPCGAWHGPPQVVPVTGSTWTAGRRAPLAVENADELFAIATASDVICIQSVSRPQLVIVRLVNDEVVRVDVNYVRGPR
jgi:hypothetical protein